MKTVKEFLTEYCLKNDWPTDVGSLEESLECGKTVWEGERDEHRWYIRIEKVVEIEGTLIKFWDYIITGDGCMSDMGLEYDLDLAKIVERKERVVKEFYYE